MTDLPKQFTEKMASLLGNDLGDYLAALEKPTVNGLRVNRSKISPEALASRVPFDLEPVSWCPDGFYIENASVRPSSHPFYNCGLYYLQEPSAMVPASFLPVEPGDRVLDLCAAPGGKSTQLAQNIQDRGLLISNDISASRSKALLKNIELFGLKNTVVTCETPSHLSEVFPEYFDKILVDAPCSGEGMFRRGDRMIRAWLEHGPDYFAPIQKSIVKEALAMLKPGGMLLYSTCTFDPAEDEEVVDYMLEICPSLRIVPTPQIDGFVHGFSQFAQHDPEGIRNTVRLFPHRIRGDGHFAALLQKEGTRSENADTDCRPVITEQEIGSGKARRTVRVQLPPMFTDPPALRYKRAGILLGEIKNGRLNPSQAYAMTLTEDEYAPSLNLPLHDERVARYLKGESLTVNDQDHLPEKGTVLIMIDGFPAGWGTIAGRRIKNKLLPGWRMMS